MADSAFCLTIKCKCFVAFPDVSCKNAEKCSQSLERFEVASMGGFDTITYYICSNFKLSLLETLFFNKREQIYNF